MNNRVDFKLNNNKMDFIVIISDKGMKSPLQLLE